VAGGAGRFPLRLEDIYETRCRDDYAAAILEDLVWPRLSRDGPLRRVLQPLLGLPTPRYRHREPMTDAAGRRLSKRDRTLTVRSMRQSGIDPAEIIAGARVYRERGGRFGAEI
jgi:glutamyl/glutaminyl-tRNA synthetase